MELNLKTSGHDFYEPVTWQPFSCETTRENIVPDSMGMLLGQTRSS